MYADGYDKAAYSGSYSFVIYIACIFYIIKRRNSIVNVSKIMDDNDVSDCATIAFIQSQSLKFHEAMAIWVDECAETQAHTLSLMFY